MVVGGVIDIRQGLVSRVDMSIGLGNGKTKKMELRKCSVSGSILSRKWTALLFQDVFPFPAGEGFPLQPRPEIGVGV